MSTNNGGPAFPHPGGSMDAAVQESYLGMTLRDYFAAKALAALIGHEGKDYQCRGPKGVPMLAAWSYEYADALLAARQASVATQAKEQ